MNIEEAKTIIKDTRFEPNIFLAVESILNEEEHLRKAFALACRFADDFALCPAVSLGQFACENSEDGPNNCVKISAWKCWQRHFAMRAATEQVCRACGCTLDNPSKCNWAKPDLCSECAGKEENGNHEKDEHSFICQIEEVTEV